MFSFIKVLDLCEENISIKFYGKTSNYKEIQDYLQKKLIGRATFIYNSVESDDFIIICKNKTCSDKLKNIKDIKEYLITNSIN